MIVKQQGMEVLGVDLSPSVSVNVTEPTKL